MDYVEARRKDRLLGVAESLALLEKGEYGFLALSDNGGGYGIPLNYAVDGDTIYFHAAPEGRKLAAIGAGANASFCVVGRTEPIPEKFTTIYESAIVQGEISVCTDEKERMRALTLLAQKYSPGLEEIAQKYIAGSKHRTAVLRLKGKTISGKAKFSK